MALSINVLLLIELIAIVIAASAFLFYINRLGGSIVSFFIRLYTWRRYHAYITIGSLQISPLAGRISFRDIEYHSSNISARALHGHITWRYWKFRVRQADDAGSNNPRRKSLPCRVYVHAQGVEVFFYNRTPAYNNIVERMRKGESDGQGSKASKTSSNSTSTSTGSEKSGLRERNSVRRDQTKTNSEESSEGAGAPGKNVPPPHVPQSCDVPHVDWHREIMPVDFSIEEGSVNLGNDATPMILIGHFRRSTGSINYTDSKSPCDHRKLLVDFGFERVKVLTRTNVDYSGPLLSHGKKAYDELLRQKSSIGSEPPSILSAFTGFHQLAREFAFLRNPKFSSPPVPGLPRDRVWRGLARYRVQDENAPKVPRREEREYAKVTTLLETPLLECTYFQDDAGLVPSLETATVVDPADEVGNIEPPPEYGIDITLHGGLLKYGPWADRQRDALQTAFAPSIFFHSDPRERLNPGDTRVHTNLIVNVLLAEETTLRIPTREPSKDWQYDSSPADVERRYGWLDIIVGANSSVVYTQSQVPTTHGYDSMLALHLDTLAIASSVNLETFIESKSCKLSITMPTPLQWDAQRDWGFDITLEDPKITLMRDHTTLISDLARDWSSGQQGDFHHFVPNQYNFRITVLNYAFHLFINDFNVIDQPGSRLENAMMDVYGPRLDAYIAVSATQYRPEFSVVPFTIEGQDFKVDLGIPRWDTHRFMTDNQTLEVGKIGKLTAEGSYRYYSEPKPEHQETLKLHLEGQRVAYKALGWVLRRMFCVKDNYFGSFTQFRTMSEFKERWDYWRATKGDPVELKFRPGKSDPYAVQVTMNVEDSLVVMSDEIYGCQQGVVIPVPQLQMSLRSQEHFMDLSLDSPPTYVLPVDDLPAVYETCSIPPIKSDVVFLEGIELKANRLFGPQPLAETYLCLWEAVVPRISGFLTVPFVFKLQSVLTAVAYGFADVENAPAFGYEVEALPDVTFFKMSLGQASLLLTDAHAATSIELAKGVNLDLSTWATRFCTSSIGIVISSISVHLLSRDDDSHEWSPVAELQGGTTVDIHSAKYEWRNHVRAQQAFIREQDARTRRIAYLYDDAKGAKPDSQYIHHVLVATPRAPDAALPDEESSEDGSDDEDSLKDPRSSPDSSEPENTPTRPRRRSRRASRPARPSWRDLSSDGDESDSATSVTTTPPLDSQRAPTDPSTVLASKIRQLRSMRRSFLDLDIDHSPSSEPLSNLMQTREHANGTIFKIMVLPIYVALQPAALQTACRLTLAFKSQTPRPEIELDKLLDAQADQFVEGAREREKTPQILDVTIPVVSVRVDTGLTGHEPTLNCVSRCLAGHLTIQPGPDNKKTDNVKLSAGIRHFDATLCTGQAQHHLQLHAQRTLPGLPVARVLLEGLDVSFDSRTQHSCSVVYCAVIDTHLVTPAFAAIADLVSVCQSQVRDLPDSPERLNTAGHLIYRMVRAAVEQSETQSQPSFANESRYGLHLANEQSIRDNPGWRIMTSVRHWMRTLSAAKDVTHDDIAHYTFASLLSMDFWEFDTMDILRQQRSVQIAFDILKASTEATDTDLLDSVAHVFVKLDVINVVHEGQRLEDSAIETSAIKLISTSFGLRHSRKHKDDHFKNEVQSVNNVKLVEVEIRNNVLPAVQPLLALVPSSDHKPPAVDSAGPSEVWSVTADNHVGTINVHLIGGGLRLSAGLQHGDLNIHVTTGQKVTSIGSPSSLHHQVLLRLQKLDLTLAALDQSKAMLDLPVDGIISYSLAQDLKLILDHRSGAAQQMPPRLRLALSLHRFEFDVRPQLRALASFGVKWKKQQYPHYQPFVEHYKHLSASKEGKVQCGKRSQCQAALDLRIKSAELEIRAAQSLWVRWDIGNVYVTGTGTAESHHFGVRIDPQIVGAYPSRRKLPAMEASKVALPSVRVIGIRRTDDTGRSISAEIDLGVFKGIIKPATLDRLLSLHHQMAAEFIDLSKQYGSGFVKAVKVIRAKDGTDSTPLDPTPADANSQADHRPRADSSRSADDIKSTPALDLRVGVQAVEIGLCADNVASTIWLTALDLKGTAKSAYKTPQSISWAAKANRLGVSLSHSADSRNRSSTRGTQSASMSLDVEVEEIAADTASAKPCVLQVNLNRVHTVAHVAALKELSDLVRSWSHDIRALREMRAAEMAEVKARTTKIIKRLETRESEGAVSKWLADRVIKIETTRIGIAVPLDAGASIDLVQRRSKTGPALLFTIRKIDFENRRNQVARFILMSMMLQFVEEFDATKADQFSGVAHDSENCMVVSKIDSQAQMSTSLDLWSLAAHSSATNFKLSLSPSVVDGIFRLIALYEQGKKHVTAIGKEYRTGLAKFGQDESVIAKYVEHTPIPSKLARQKIVVRMSFYFASGVVELAKVSFIPPYGAARRTENLPATGRAILMKPTELKLPGISSWVDYEGAVVGVDDNDEAAMLIVNTAIHESTNTLSPTILPFVVEMVDKIRSHQDSAVNASSPSSPPAVDEVVDTTVSAHVGESALNAIAKAPTGRLRLRATLRIDQSTLTFRSGSDTSLLDLTWSSGGFVASTTLGADQVTSFAGTISGVALDLRGAFDRGQSCLTAGAQDMTFTLAYCPSGLHHGQRGLSFVLDTSISSQFRLDFYYAFLVLSTEWIDNAPKLAKPMIVQPDDAPACARPSPKLQLAIGAIVRVRQIEFDTDIVVSRAKLSITPLLVKTMSDGENTKIEVRLGTTCVKAEGQISGNVTSQSLVLKSSRRSSRAREHAIASVLTMSIEGGLLAGHALIADKSVMQFQLLPTTVTLKDDWSAYTDSGTGDVTLHFDVKAGKFIGVTRLSDIPNLTGYLYKLIDQIPRQEDRAAQSSSVYGRVRERKVNEPSVLAAALQTARKTSLTATATGQVKTREVMNLHLDGVDLGAFAQGSVEGRSIDDFYRYEVGPSGAQFSRYIDALYHRRRDIEVDVDYVKWFNVRGEDARSIESNSKDTPDFFDSLGTLKQSELKLHLVHTTVRMNSEQVPDEPRDRLRHDCSLDFERRAQGSDVKIHPKYWRETFGVFGQFILGLDERQQIRGHKSGPPRAREDGAAKHDDNADIVFERRHGAVNAPDLDMLGQDVMAKLVGIVPGLQDNMNDKTPVIVHRFVTVPLEDAMEQLLKLYAKLLPDKGAEEEEAERKDTDTPHRPDTLP